jgi:hypothetical protein
MNIIWAWKFWCLKFCVGIKIIYRCLNIWYPEFAAQNTLEFDRNFYYGPEGGAAEICLNVTNYTSIITGM